MARLSMCWATELPPHLRNWKAQANGLVKRQLELTTPNTQIQHADELAQRPIKVHLEPKMQHVHWFCTAGGAAAMKDAPKIEFLHTCHYNTAIGTTAIEDTSKIENSASSATTAPQLSQQPLKMHLRNEDSAHLQIGSTDVKDTLRN